MKPVFLLGLLLLFSVGLFAQECANQRYFEEIFSLDLTPNVKFGEAPQPTLLNPNNIQQLYMDVYEPDGDTLSARPLIIWAFGGAFVFGSKLSPDIVALSRAFARRGYVNAAIDYRLSSDLLFNNDISKVYEATLKATHDMLASIRYFYQDAATVNEFRIDTSRIYIGGVSAGAITALQIAHFDELAEVPAEINSLFQASGGFSGNSGNPGYSEEIAGVINLCGAVLDTAWINPALPTPIVSMHGTEDDVVPYGSDTITILGIDLPVDGSASIHHKLAQHGIENDFYTFPGAGHTPFVLNQAYLDTTIQFVRDFLYDLVCDELTSVEEIANVSPPAMTIYPNPNQGNFAIRNVSGETLHITIMDHLSREVFSKSELPQGVHPLTLDVPTGLYTVRAYSSHRKGAFSQRIIVQ